MSIYQFHPLNTAVAAPLGSQAATGIHEIKSYSSSKGTLKNTWPPLLYTTCLVSECVALDFWLTLISTIWDMHSSCCSLVNHSFTPLTSHADLHFLSGHLCSAYLQLHYSKHFTIVPPSPAHIHTLLAEAAVQTANELIRRNQGFLLKETLTPSVEKLGIDPLDGHSTRWAMLPAKA